MKKLHRNCSKHSASDKVLRLIRLACPSSWRFSSSSSIQIARQASKLFPGNSFAAQEQPDEARNSCAVFIELWRKIYVYLYVQMFRRPLVPKRYGVFRTRIKSNPPTACWPLPGNSWSCCSSDNFVTTQVLAREVRRYSQRR